MNALGRLPSAGSGAASGPPTRGSQARWGMKSEVFRSNSTHRAKLRPPAPCAPRTTRSSRPPPSLRRRRPFREAPQDLRRRGRCRTRSGGQGSGGARARKPSDFFIPDFYFIRIYAYYTYTCMYKYSILKYAYTYTMEDKAAQAQALDRGNQKKFGKFDF
jgi:hypothetical protein